jgi:molybdate/tungstate transport system substrate-binding protein
MCWVLATMLLAACSRGRSAPAAPDTLDVYVASSLDAAVGGVLGRYAAAHHVVVRRESGASVELVRRLTELHRVPDLLVLADAELFPRLLIPQYASWYAGIATDHMVLAFTPRSRFAARVDSANWMNIVQRPGVEVGRADPSVAPVGYRTLLLFQRAEAFYHRQGLADSLLASAPARNVRGNASALAALLGTGELDYMYDYRSVAQAKGFLYVTLPPAVDLSDSILSALTIPDSAPHPAAARGFLADLLGPDGRAAFAAAHVELLPRVRFVGTDTPAVIRDAAHATP